MLPGDLVYRKMFGFVEEKKKVSELGVVAHNSNPSRGQSGLVSSRTATDKQQEGLTLAAEADLELTFSSMSPQLG